MLSGLGDHIETRGNQNLIPRSNKSMSLNLVVVQTRLCDVLSVFSVDDRLHHAHDHVPILLQLHPELHGPSHQNSGSRLPEDGYHLL